MVPKSCKPTNIASRKVDVSARHQEPVTGPRGREGQMPFLVEFLWDIPRDIEPMMI